jgi:epsilon-lactone hydrolase
LLIHNKLFSNIQFWKQQSNLDKKGNVSKRDWMSMSTVANVTISFSVLLVLLVAGHSHFQSLYAQDKPEQLYIPTTVSETAQKEMLNLPASFDFEVPAPNDLSGWRTLNQMLESGAMNLSQSTADLFEPTITEISLGGINALDIKPKNWTDNGKVLVYTHGGAYTLLSANSTLWLSILAADSTGLRVISIDYTVAPFAKWSQSTDEVISAVQALKNQEGYSLEDIAIYGDSAGGGLAAGTVLKMRDNGMGMPAAVVLWSPWADVTENGDTYITLKDSDPFLGNTSLLKNSADAYANPGDQKNPYVSPVYANYSKGFPPTLIQGGTKEIFLSDFVRLYQALDQSGVPAKLDIYEGMPHVFQALLVNTPESDIALSKMNNFLKSHLDY